MMLRNLSFKIMVVRDTIRVWFSNIVMFLFLKAFRRVICCKPKPGACWRCFCFYKDLGVEFRVSEGKATPTLISVEPLGRPSLPEHLDVTPEVAAYLQGIPDKAWYDRDYTFYWMASGGTAIPVLWIRLAAIATGFDRDLSPASPPTALNTMWFYGAGGEYIVAGRESLFNTVVDFVYNIAESQVLGRRMDSRLPHPSWERLLDPAFEQLAKYKFWPYVACQILWQANITREIDIKELHKIPFSRAYANKFKAADEIYAKAVDAFSNAKTPEDMKESFKAISDWNLADKDIIDERHTLYNSVGST